VSDTVTILTAYDFPKEVIRVASQHHGSCILQAIYEYAVKEDGSFEDKKDLFRYKTPRPDSLESLILMLSDQIEATSRAVYSDQSVDIDPSIFVTRIIKSCTWMASLITSRWC